MPLITKSYEQLFQKPSTYQTKLEYNRRLGPFNANISLRNHTIQVNLNLQWKDIDEEIKIGLIQHLLTRLFKSKRHTQNIELYNNFIKNIPILTPKTKTHPVLEASFNRMNEQFLDNQLEKPNLEWGKAAFRKLAHYNFHNDTILVSSIFQDAPQEVLDYIIYHEMLHKHHKFKQKNGRSSYHSREFRQDERRYPNHQLIEKQISQIIRQKKKPRGFWDHFF